MIDINAPIIPGKGAGGIELGTNLQNILKDLNGFFEVEREIITGIGDVGVFRYRSSNIDLWVKDNLVYQIMVHGSYEGKVHDKIGIGSTIAAVRAAFGEIKVDMDDLVVEDLGGISFEPIAENDDSPIAEMYIFKPDWTELK